MVLYPRPKERVDSRLHEGREVDEGGEVLPSGKAGQG